MAAAPGPVTARRRPGRAGPAREPVHRARSRRGGGLAAVPRARGLTPDVAAGIRRDLAGRDLACWCPLPAAGEPDLCHAAALLVIAN
jgi:Domain of unknown function (DUF4326)